MQATSTRSMLRRALQLRARAAGARSSSSGGGGGFSALDEERKAGLVSRLLAAKEASGQSFDQLAQRLGLTNAYTANLFFAQAQLTEATAVKLRAAVPGISEEDLSELRKAPMRSFDPRILQEPTVYRTYEAITHYGQAIKALVNEKCGDGIMSAIDCFVEVGTTTGHLGEKRVVIMFNGKFLPHVEQAAHLNGVPAPHDE